MKRALIAALVAAGVFGGTVEAHPWVFVEDHYTVQSGDTLSKIANEFIKKNTYAPREIREFTEGIKELNPELLKRDVIPGEVININYWIPNAEEF